MQQHIKDYKLCFTQKICRLFSVETLKTKDLNFKSYLNFIIFFFYSFIKHSFKNTNKNSHQSKIKLNLKIRKMELIDCKLITFSINTT